MSEEEELSTGWEPGVPVEDTLLRRFLFAERDRMRLVAEASGGQVEATDRYQLTAPAGGLDWDHAVLLLRPPRPGDVEDVMAAADRFFGPGQAWVLWSMWPTPDLAPFGMQVMGHPPFMFRPTGGGTADAPPGLRIVEATTATQLDAFTAVLREAFPLCGRGAVAAPAVLGGHLRFWLGYEGDRAVSVAAAHAGYGVNDVIWVATLQDARGKGYGRALTWRAALSEPELPAVLIASDDGRPVYERLGFVSVLRITLWWRQGRSE